MTKTTIGILQPGHAPAGLASKQGDYDQCFRTLLGEDTFTYISYDVEAGELPASTAEADGWLITGSRHGAYEDHPWRDPLEDFIRSAYAGGRPLVGICFGHQIIARALGGEVKRADVGWIAGPQTYEGPGDMRFAVNAWHRDQVTKVPEDLEVFLKGEGCPVAGLFETGRVLTFQPHPEFSPAYTAALFEERGNALPETLQAVLPERIRDIPLNQDYVADMIRAFLSDPDYRP
ncbi:type 1 glutamine amidotransferase [Breoghania sp.]|uniref:type 1 glutamine amidotransferase n=1 Tax=Breoghania sp. TaxID=2065378 RepID=UPI002AA71BD6|nr:type 1 glutamine amidotransferase [Breoghania sp.]